MDDHVLILASDDKPLVRNVEAALRKAKIECVTGDDGAIANRKFEVYVAANDHARAMNIAGPVMARRTKFKSYPPIQPLPEFPGSNSNPDTPSLSGF